jgi:hypothetical protein
MNQPYLPWDDDLLVVADTGNNRILIISLTTFKCVETIGTGQIGLIDGQYSESRFHHP